jgi:integrase/recombinase XerD
MEKCATLFVIDYTKNLYATKFEAFMSPDPKIPSHITGRISLVPAINSWRIYLNDQGKSPHTVKAFTADLLLLASFLPPDRPLGAITTNELNNFLEWMQKQRGVPCSPKTLSRRITSLKSFFRWLIQYGVILVDPGEKVLQQSVISPLPQVLSPDETKSALEVASRHRQSLQPDARLYTLLALLLETGIKKSECLALSPNHIDLEAPTGPNLFVRYSSPQHRYKERKIAITQDWVEAYDEYKQQYHPGDRLFPWSQRRLEYLLEDIGEEAGLSKHISFEMCRWTCALTDLQSGMEANKVRQKMGLSKIQWREVNLKLQKLGGQTPI